MKKKFEQNIVISKKDYENNLKMAEARGNNNLLDAHRKILSNIQGYKERFKNEPQLERANILFILDQIITS